MIVLPRTTVDDRDVQNAVEKVLNTNEWPIFKIQDDSGLEESEYLEFTMAVLRQLSRS